MKSSNLHAAGLVKCLVCSALIAGALLAIPRLSPAVDSPPASGPAPAAVSDALPKWAVARLGNNDPKAAHWGVYRVLFSPDARQLATRGADQIVRAWDLSSGKQLVAIDGHQDRVTGLAYSPDGKVLATSSPGENESIKLWDAASGKLVREISHPATIVEFGRNSADLFGRAVDLIAVSPTEVARFNASSGEQLDLRRRRWTPLAVSSGGEWVALDNAPGANGQRTVGVHNVAKDTLNVLDPPFEAQCVEFSPDSAWVAAGGRRENLVRMWDLRHENRSSTLSGHAGPVQAVAFSRDGRHLATASWDKTIRIWELNSGRLIVTLEGHREHVCAVAFSSDGLRLASGASGETDTSVLIWDLKAAMYTPSVAANKVDGAVLEGLWQQLSDEDPATAYGAIATLISVPNAAMPLITRRISSNVLSAGGEAIKKLIAQLDDDDFSVREAAQKRLTDIRDAASVQLKEAMEKTNSAEVSHRIQKILAAPVQTVMRGDPDRRRLRRLMLVLETIGTPAAREQLSVIANDPTDSDLRREALAAIARFPASKEKGS